MSTPPASTNAVRTNRLARGWSQQELAERAGLSRAGVSAIEAGRLAPSVNAALALARALGATVEALFAPQGEAVATLAWAMPPAQPRPRYWTARVGGQLLAYAVEDDSPQLDWHDGVVAKGAPLTADNLLADRTLVVACCDPAAGLLAAEYARQSPFRMIVLRRSSRRALELLAAGKVHAAGVHLGQTARADIESGQQARLPVNAVRVARWEEGLAVQPGSASSIGSIVRSKARWVGREPGSGARQCQDQVLAGRPAPKRVAYDHRSVAATVRCGWADIGPCVRLAAEESGLGFLKVRDQDYDLCFAAASQSDPRLVALLATLRSPDYRARLAELPGYSTRHTGELVG